MVDDKRSTVMEIPAGVLQQSIFDPLLFILFINDLPYSLKFCNVTLFANDTQIYLSFSSLNEIESKHNVDMKKPVGSTIICRHLALNNRNCIILVAHKNLNLVAAYGLLSKDIKSNNLITLYSWKVRFVKILSGLITPQLCA